MARAHRRLPTPIALTLGIHPHNNGKYDISNRIKPLEDALVAAGVMVDDKQIVDLHVVRLPPIRGSRLMIIIEEVPTYSEMDMLSLFAPKEKPRAPVETRGEGLRPVTLRGAGCAPQSASSRAAAAR